MGEYQKELFDQFNTDKGKFDKIADKIKKRKKPYVHIPAENLFFYAIVFVMCIVIAFALGVERGKRTREVTTSPEKEDLYEIQEKSLAKKGVLLYTIQLISYRKGEFAERERDKLKNAGLEAFIISSGEWHQVCAGTYKSIQEAKAAQNQFAKTYKGCFIRRR